MGSATIQAIGGAKRALDGVPAADRLATGRALFAAAATIADSAPLRAALADGAAPVSAKTAVVDRVFAGLGASARAVLNTVVSTRWSSQGDLVSGIEEVAVRAVASSAPASVSISGELAAFGTAVSSDPELEYAVGSALVPGATKAKVVVSLLQGKASEQTVEILSRVIAAPTARRIGDLLRDTIAIVADEAGRSVATVESAAPLTDAQLLRIRASLTQRSGREVSLEHVVTPALVGGIRIRLGDEVIDGSVSRRLAELRLSLAG
jgi:F-type H+-transporting ATPase subunit delta